MKSIILFLTATALTSVSLAKVDCVIQAQGKNAIPATTQAQYVNSDAGNYEAYYVKLSTEKNYSVVAVRSPAVGQEAQGMIPSLTVQVFENYELNNWTASAHELLKKQSVDGQSIHSEVVLEGVQYQILCNAK